MKKYSGYSGLINDIDFIFIDKIDLLVPTRREDF